MLYVAAEKDPLHLHALRNRFLRTPNVVVQRMSPEDPEAVAGMENCFNTVLCVNVLEYLEDPAAAVARLRTTLKPGGLLVILVPQGAGLFGSLDQRLGHKRRFSPAEVRTLLESQGLVVEKVGQFNKAGTPPWWAYSKMLGSKNINKPVLKIFDKTVWLWSRLEWLMPWRGLSLIVVGRRPADTPSDPTPLSSVNTSVISV
jgi:SAM-dependent methyltransferase